MNLALIGTGRWGANILKALNTLDHKVISYNTQKDWRDLFKNNISGVIVAADPRINWRVVEECNERNLPVFLEKPAALFLDDIYKMEKCRIPILVDYIHLFNPKYLELKYRLTAPISRIVSIGANNGPFRHYSSLYDYGTHDFSMVMDLLPESFKLQSANVKRGANGGQLFQLEYNVGPVAVDILTGNGASKKTRKLIVFCQDGSSFIYEDEPSRLPLLNALTHFTEVIDGAALKIPFELTVRIHKALYELGARYEHK